VEQAFRPLRVEQTARIRGVEQAFSVCGLAAKTSGFSR